MIGVEIKTVSPDAKKPDMAVAEKALEVLKSAGFSEDVLKEVKDLLAEECSESSAEEKKEETPSKTTESATPTDKPYDMQQAFEKFKSAFQK